MLGVGNQVKLVFKEKIVDMKNDIIILQKINIITGHNNWLLFINI